MTRLDGSPLVFAGKPIPFSCNFIMLPGPKDCSTVHVLFQGVKSCIVLFMLSTADPKKKKRALVLVLRKSQLKEMSG